MREFTFDGVKDWRIDIAENMLVPLVCSQEIRSCATGDAKEKTEKYLPPEGRTVEQPQAAEDVSAGLLVSVESS